MKSLLALIFLTNVSFSKNIDFLDIKVFAPELEISGLLYLDDSLYAISDNRYDVYLYNLKRNDAKSAYKAQKSLRNLEGFWSYYISSLLWKQNGRWIKSPWDLEGAAVCANDYYLVNEQVRDVIVVRDNALQKIPLDLESAFAKLGVPIENTALNAGFEGLAVDCDRKVLYVAQERGPRAIFVFNLKNGNFLNLIQTKEDNNPHPDYADLYFEKDSLYVLERNTHRVLKLSLSGDVVDTRSFDQISTGLMTKELYDTGEPYGLAEALYLDENFIYLGLDNNGSPFSEKAKKMFKIEVKNGSSLLRFKRPRGF